MIDSPPADVSSALRFLGLFLRYHVDMQPEVRRNTLALLNPVRA
jgi:hypothetical protein